MQDVQEKIKEFQRLRAEKGEAAFEEAVRAYAEQLMAAGGSGVMQDFAASFVAAFQKEEAAYREAAKQRAAEQDVKAERLKERKPSEFEGNQDFLKVLQGSLPAMRSQAQFNTFMAAFEALRGLFNAIFAGDERATREFSKAMQQAIEAAAQATDLTEKLSEVPEAAESKLADDFKKPPRQFGEYDLQRELMAELENVKTVEALTAWWTGNRRRIDEVVSPTLRNPLIDAVRAKKEELLAAS